MGTFPVGFVYEVIVVVVVVVRYGSGPECMKMTTDVVLVAISTTTTDTATTGSTGSSMGNERRVGLYRSGR